MQFIVNIPHHEVQMIAFISMQMRSYCNNENYAMISNLGARAVMGCSAILPSLTPLNGTVAQDCVKVTRTQDMQRGSKEGLMS